VRYLTKFSAKGKKKGKVVPAGRGEWGVDV
jgi:hypothetical protein